MTDSPKFPYATFLDVKFPQSAVVDAPALIKAVTAAIIPTGDA